MKGWQRQRRWRESARVLEEEQGWWFICLYIIRKFRYWCDFNMAVTSTWLDHSRTSIIPHFLVLLCSVLAIDKVNIGNFRGYVSLSTCLRGFVKAPSPENATRTSMLEKYSAEQFFIQLSSCYTQLPSGYRECMHWSWICGYLTKRLSRRGLELSVQTPWGSCTVRYYCITRRNREYWEGK